jgi:signal transduction histidine kinase
VEVENNLTKEFHEFEKEMVNTAGRCDETLNQVSLTNATDSIIQFAFKTLERSTQRGSTVELYNDKKKLLAWSGEKGIEVDTSQLSGKKSFFLVESPLYMYAILIVPLQQDDILRGYIVVKRFFDVNYPLGNRYINNETFGTSFSSKLDVKPKFILSKEVHTEADSEYFVIALRTQDNNIVGYALYPTPRSEDYLHFLDDVFQRCRNLLYVLLALTLLLFSLRIVQTIRLVVVKIVVWTLSLWLFRYCLVWSDVFHDNIEWEIFQPSYFASSFGFGIARSVGDLLVTSIFLLGNVLIVFSILRTRLTSPNENERLPLISNKLFCDIVQLGFALFVVLFSRGYAAVVRSAVFDSTLQYYNPIYIIPPLPLGLMLFSLLIITAAFVFVSYGLFVLSLIMTRQIYQDKSETGQWLLVVARFAVVGFFFGIIHPTPLLTQATRLGLIVVLALIVAVSVRLSRVKPSLVYTTTFSLLSACSIVFLMKTMDEYIHENDRAQVELLARSITRPVDSWMTFVVTSTLDEISQPSYTSLLQNTNVVEREKIAFKAWANSPLSTEGFHCAVTYVDTSGNIISDFHLGEVRHKNIELPTTSSSVELEEQFVSGLTLKTYRGNAPLVSSEGKQIGGVFVEVTAHRQALFSRESPDILRNYTGSESRTQSRTIVYSEYHKGDLIYSSSEDIPYSRKLSSELHQSVSALGGLWLDEVIEGKRYESYYFPSGDGIIALSMEYLTLQWHVFVIIRVILFFLLLFMGVLLILIFASHFRKRRIPLNVRTKLLLAFVIISLIPIAVLAYYNRLYALERSEKNLARRLQDETELVASSLLHHYGYATPSELDRLTDVQAEQIAEDINLDFNLFRDVHVSATSKPEVFAAELFDERLSSDAYLNLILKEKKFFYEQRFIGTLSYLVGYRPLQAQSGEIIGIVSVPTIFRQRAIYDELLERNAYLFSVYAIALVLAVGFGWVFAHQISAPVRRLQQAARRISSGDLNVRISSNRADEFGELEQTFNTMVNDLREFQERLVRVQREQAWKEMAKQVAHEIKNPLTPMRLSIQHLRQAYRDGVKNFEELLNHISETVLGQIESLSKIASEFSHFARMPERRMEECDVHNVLQEVKQLFEQHKGLRFSVSLKANRSLVFADREELRRAFINIIRNALQAMNEQGTIAIETGAIAGTMEIRISDTGPGIPVELRDKLFEPNFSTKTEGMGLGLAIVKRIIDDCGGKITIESTMGKGTTVIMQLPLFDNEEPRSQRWDGRRQ